MIGVDGQYIAWFNIAEKKDFIEEDSLLSFTIIEEAGNVLPTFELMFTQDDSKIIKYINEGNILGFTFGKSLESAQYTTRLRITSKNIVRQGSKYQITITGLTNTLDYVASCKVRQFAGMSGVAAIKSVCSEYFSMVSNVSTSTDSQTWVQYNTPDKEFVNQLWMHSYIPRSFLAIGITIENKFILKDIIKAIKDKPKWTFISKDSKKANEIAIDGDYALQSDSGFINHWIGYGRTKELRNIDTGSDIQLSASPSPILATNSKLDRSDPGRRVAPFSLLNDNVHTNYWSAYYQNMMYLTLMNSIRVVLSYSNQFVDMSVLDLVMFEERDSEDIMLNEQLSGLYFITKIVRTYTKKKLIVTCELNRESFGSIRGEFK